MIPEHIRTEIEQVFKIHEEDFEVETWTNGGYNVILSVDEWTIPEVVKAIQQFDPSDEVYLWWSDESFRDNYNRDMFEALDDMKSWKEHALNILNP